jgi:hypothetical protein
MLSEIAQRPTTAANVLQLQTFGNSLTMALRAKSILLMKRPGKIRAYWFYQSQK